MLRDFLEEGSGSPTFKFLELRVAQSAKKTYRVEGVPSRGQDAEWYCGEMAETAVDEIGQQCEEHGIILLV
jgi:hypothetical protein